MFKFVKIPLLILGFVILAGYMNIGSFISECRGKDVNISSFKSAQNGTKVKKFKLESSYEYKAAETENFIMKNLDILGFNETNPHKSKGCSLFKEKSIISEKVVSTFTNFVRDLTTNFTFHQSRFEPVQNVMKKIQNAAEEEIPNICKSLKLKQDASITNFFPNSKLSYSSSMGYMEPLLPPMRHPKYCERGKYLLNLDYLVHDFEAMCKTLRPHSKLVLIDMGAGKSIFLFSLTLNSYSNFFFHLRFGTRKRSCDPTS